MLRFVKLLSRDNRPYRSPVLVPCPLSQVPFAGSSNDLSNARPYRPCGVPRIRTDARGRTDHTLSAADAGPFLGTWVVTLQTPQGNLEQTVTLKETNGKVLGDISSNMQPGSQPIDEISKSGNDLVLKFQGDFQGTAFQAAITMTLDGADKANCTFDVMNGQFVMQGTAVKK